MSRLTPYYSGAQAQIFFGDQFIDECYSIQFEVVTNRSALYGYASHKFDTVLEGNVLVSGVFAVNFIHQNYVLAAIDQKWKKDLQGKGKIGPQLHTDKKLGLGLTGSSNFLPTVEGANPHNSRKAYRGALNLGNSDWMKLQKSIQDELKARANKRAVSSNGQTILVNANEKLGVVDQFYNTPAFDIYITLGDNPNPGSDSAATPVRRLRNVVLTSNGQTITSSGDPILETYRFIARDLI